MKLHQSLSHAPFHVGKCTFVEIVVHGKEVALHLDQLFATFILLLIPPLVMFLLEHMGDEQDNFLKTGYV